MRTLFVRSVPASELMEQWKLEHLNAFPKGTVIQLGPLDCRVYVRCRENGQINWNSTQVYTIQELIHYPNVRIVEVAAVKDIPMELKTQLAPTIAQQN